MGIMIKMKLSKLSFLGLMPFLFSACTTARPWPESLNSDTDWPFERFKINQEFGKTPYASQYTSKSHWGTDITHGALASVRPVAEGFIVAVGTEDCPNLPGPDCNGGHGNWVLIEHPQLGFRSFYGHLAEKSKLKPTQAVSRNEVIGREGRSGNIFNLDGTQAGTTSDTHLHLSIGDIRSRHDRSGQNVITIGPIRNPREVLPPVSDQGR